MHITGNSINGRKGKDKVKLEIVTSENQKKFTKTSKSVNEDFEEMSLEEARKDLEKAKEMLQKISSKPDPDDIA